MSSYVEVPSKGHPESVTFLEKLRRDERLQLILCWLGVMGSLLIYGVLQERVMTLPYGSKDNPEYFKYSLFLVLCNRLVTCLVSFALLLVHGKREELTPVAPIHSYAAVSLSNVVATTCQYEALRYLKFAIQTLGKCAKMFPVMIWGFLIMRKKYGWRDVLVALAITGGCFLFFMTGDVTSRVAKKSSNTSLFGVSLMMGYLAFDGFTSTFQEKLFKGYKMSTYNQVMYTSLCSATISLTGLVAYNQLLPALQFLVSYPEATLAILVLSMAATIGSLCISYTIKTFGALVFATIMTTRQFLSILMSSLVFGTPLTPGQWLSTGIIIGTLYYQAFTKKDKKSAHKAEEQPLPTATVTNPLKAAKGEMAEPLLA